MRLREVGLVGRIQWDTYFPETGRYGTGLAMAAAETVFAADSAAAVTQLASAATGTPHPAVSAASFVDLAVSFTGSIAAGTRWLVDNIAKLAGTAPDRASRSTPSKVPAGTSASRPCQTTGRRPT